MFSLDDVDLKDIALEIAKEPATKEDGKPLITNGKPVTKIEKILRSWAVSDNPDLQKRYMDIVSKEEILEEKSFRDLIEMVVMACTGNDEFRADMLQSLTDLATKHDTLESIENMKRKMEDYNKRLKPPTIHLPKNGRDEEPEYKPGDTVMYYDHTKVEP